MACACTQGLRKTTPPRIKYNSIASALSENQQKTQPSLYPQEKIDMEIDKSKFSPETQVLIDLLQSSEWPEAVSPLLICSETEEDKIERAQNIIDYINYDIKNKKVLDFGCGEGHVSAEAAKTSILSVGYDIKQSGRLVWDNPSPYLLTTDFSKIQANGPYDFIILYDVLDHTADPLYALKQVKSLCSEKAKIFVRCHTWMGRHSGHLYQKLNKAWVHLIFTPEEFEIMGIKLEPIYKCYFPVVTQKKWFQDAGLRLNSENVITCAIEPFFRRQEIMKRLPLKEYEGKFPEWQLSQTFNDYTLSIQ